MILDLAGYRADEDLAARYAVEPSAGEGAFLVPMVRRLLASLTVHGRKLSDARESIHAYELDADSAARAAQLVGRELREHGASMLEAREVAEGWVSVGDYLLASPPDRRADLVVGNPPYIRYDDLPAQALSAYRRLYPAMVGRCDIYVGFIEAGLRQLKDGGVLGLICADRWMRSAYGAELRRMITSAFGVEAVIEMHDAPAFEDVVAAYPAVIVIRRAPQRTVTVASAGPGGRAAARRREPGRQGREAGPWPGGRCAGIRRDHGGPVVPRDRAVAVAAAAAAWAAAAAGGPVRPAGRRPDGHEGRHRGCHGRGPRVHHHRPGGGRTRPGPAARDDRRHAAWR